MGRWGTTDDEALLAEISAMGTRLEAERDLDPLLERIGDARYVLLGEASHGTSEYYRWRAAITRRLVAERGFSFVAVEGDWPDCAEVNQWVKGRTGVDRTAREVMGGFSRWPTWMWANEEVVELVDWLRDHNRATGADVGFYGLDVYSLWDSMRAIIDHVSEHEPEAVDVALQAARCFEPYREDPQRYAWATRMVPTSCEDHVLELLVEIGAHASASNGAGEAELDAVQNAEVVAGAERYYRTMVRGDGESWNVRDTHMVDTLDRLMAHHGPAAKAVVWEHNTHIGDARATDMARAGMVNVGQLVRERHGEDGVVLVGFSGYRGEVVAAEAWGAAQRRFPVPPAPPGSHELLLHQALGTASLLVFPEDRASPWLTATRGHRAIGVVYDPQRDRYGNWVPTVMGGRYDALCSFDDTTALHPLHPEVAQPGAEQETSPWGT